MSKVRHFLQLAFNNTYGDFVRLVSKIPSNPNIIIEAGTPLLKKEGISVISKMKIYWPHQVVADIKVVDGARQEVAICAQAGADIVTATGNSSTETLKIFINSCRDFGVKSAVDMIHVSNPLRVLWKANVIPDIVYIHRGRDEENSFGKVIQYKEIAKIKGKWDILVGAAGGIDQLEMRSALFNGADIVVVNVVGPSDPWTGIKDDVDFQYNLDKFLSSISN